MPTQKIITPDKLKITSHNIDEVIFVSTPNKQVISFTNNDTDEADATNFFFTIDKADWEFVKEFIDEQFKN